MCHERAPRAALKSPTKEAYLDLADCALAPIIYYAVSVPQTLNGSNVLENSPKVNNWWQWVQQQEPVAKVLAEIEEGLSAFMTKD